MTTIAPEPCFYGPSHRWQVVKKEPQDVVGDPYPSTDPVAWELYRARWQHRPVLVTYRCTCGAEKVERI